MSSTSRKLDAEAIEKWSVVGQGLLQVAVGEDSNAIIEAIKLLSSAIPYLGPILNILLDMLPGTDEFAEFREEFLKMESHLFAIENKIDALYEHVTATSILSYYKSIAQRINVIQETYKQYLYKNTDINMLELIDKCKRNSIMNYVYYVRQELAGSTTLPLMTVMKDNNNLANFQSWMKMLVSSISQSMMLNTICRFSQYSNHTSLDETIAGDISYFNNLTELMIKVVNDGTNDIKRDFFETAKKEINSYASVNNFMGHSEFADMVCEMLAKKYFWRHWFVLSYDDKKYGEGWHYVTFASQYVYAWFRKHERNVNVVHTNNNDDSITNKLKTCMEKKEWGICEVSSHNSDMCKWVYEYVDPCIGYTNSLGVIALQSEFSASFSKGIAAFYTVHSPRNHGFTVFAVASEKW